MTGTRPGAPAERERVQDSNTVSGALMVLRRRWPIIALIVLVCIGVAVLRYEGTAKHYNATASVSFDNTSLTAAALQVTPGSGDPTRDAATNVLVATSRQVATGVRKELASTLTPDELLQSVSVQAAANANVLEFTASTGSPQYSARLANAFADQYVAFESQSQVNGIDAAQAQLQQQLRGLPPTSSNAAALQQSIQRLSQLRAVANGGVQVISRAATPSGPSGLTGPTTVALGALVGLALALLLTTLLESLDHRVDSVEEIEREYRLPLLAVVPQRAFREDAAADRDEELEPYRILRSALDLEAMARKLDTLLITSAVANEGKTTVAIDLAHAIALTGRRVTLLELDLRQPTLGAQCGLDPRQGFTNVISGEESLSDLLVQPFPELPEFSVLPSGPLPSNPAELLESSAVANVLAEAVTPGGIVVIDSPPLNPVADTHVLLSNPAVNAALIVARIRHVTRQQIRQARAILDLHMLEPVGVVVTGMREGRRYGYGGYRRRPSGAESNRDQKQPALVSPRSRGSE
jgi:polysaccharide biosynthesis transport protein